LIRILSLALVLEVASLLTRGALCLPPRPAQADELGALGGLTRNARSDDRSFAWQLEYLAGLGEHFALGLSYLNEGHVPNHHRDGYAASLWARTSLLDRRLSLAAGAGPYLFADTVAVNGPGQLRDNHGVGALLSGAITWSFDPHWFLRLQANRAETGSSIDTFTAVIGVGYQLDRSAPEPAPEARLRTATVQNELTILAGSSVLSAFDRDDAVATGLEYRRQLWRYVDWTVAWLYEADAHAYRRNGLMTELWAVRPLAADRLVVGIGAGPYVVLDHNDDSQAQATGERAVSAVVSLTGTYRFLPHWDVRATWHRLLTNYDQDADVILAGIGFRF